MSRRIPIRFKLISALAVPIVALLVISAFQVFQSRNDADDVRDQANLARAAIGPAGVINALQDERNAASVLKILNIGIDLPVDSYGEAIERTDAAFEGFEAELDRLGPEARAAYQPALEKLEHLEALRATVNERVAERGEPVPPNSFQNIDISAEVFDDYTTDIGLLIDATSQLVIDIDDVTLRQGVELSDLATRQTDLIAQSFSSIFRPFAFREGRADNRYNEETTVTQAGLLSEVETVERQIAALGTSSFADDVDQLLREANELGFNEKAREAINLGEDLDLATIAEMRASVSADRDQAYYGFRNRIGEQVEDRADALVDAANNRQRLFSAMAGMALMVAMAVTWLVSRSITRPLRSLTQQAQDMAEHRLPDAVLDILETPLGEDVTMPQIEPVTVRTRDEVADVADALNTVQDSALDLAVEQAVLRRNIADSFVNLGRRNQNLLGRQLDFITELESNETDPDTLASLFRLDHLATRMRRNAESLLVLAGIEPPRKWAAPVRITDVIRAALGEVEDYQRVTVRGVEPATILGSAAADIAHLIAEFVENALTFSPPDQQVDIRGRHRPDTGGYATGGYTLAVIDSGFGMPAAGLVEANRRLNGAESFTVAPSKYLGHYVAGNLAGRHGIRLKLDNSPGNGVTATVELPASLLTTEEPTDEPITDPHGTRRVTPDVPVASDPEPPAMAEATAAAPATAHTAVDANARAERTPGGLVKRTPRRGPAAPDRSAQDEVLASLANLHLRATRGPASPPRPASPSPRLAPTPPAPPHPPAPAGAETTQGGLARRVPGSHMPDTGLVNMPRDRHQEPRSEPDAASEPHDPGDVYGFLTSFTSGVQRGLDASRSPDGGSSPFFGDAR